MVGAINKLHSLIDCFRKWLKCNKQDVLLCEIVSSGYRNICVYQPTIRLFFTFDTFIIYQYVGLDSPYGGMERSEQGAGGETRGEETAGETQALMGG